MTESAIATVALTKQFDRYVAVNDVYLQIPKGEVYGLIGPNGAGKTTLIRMLATAEEPTTGTISILGQPLLLDNTNPQLKQIIGYLPDDFPLYEDLDVWDYLEYFACLYHLKQPHRRRRLQEVLELVQLTHKRRSPIATLSRGMKQRLSLARTIIHDPLILLLDEPVSGLDPITRQQFRQIMSSLQQGGMTIVISSHILTDLAEMCTSVGIMELGYLVESAPLTELYQKLSRQQIIISILGDREKLKAELRNHSSMVEELEDLPKPGSLKVYFKGTQADQAILLRALLEADIEVVEFNPTQEDLETIFFKLGHQQAS